MDLGSESVEENQVNPQTVSQVDDTDSNEIKNNGSCANETENAVESRENHVDTAQPVNSTLVAAKSPGRGSHPTARGHGLKKWKRIKRNSVTDASGNAIDDSNKVLKRGLSGSGNPVKPQNSSTEIKHNSEGSVGSVNMLRSVGVDGFAIHGSSSDSRFAAGLAFAAGSGFSAGADSENSEDWSSKSSTAASAPKARYDLPAVFGHVWDRSRMKSTSGKSLSSSAQRAQQGKGRIESSKKARGDRDNSYSSVESDSRSSNFVFMQAATLTSNGNVGKQSGRSMSHDGENSDEAHASEQQFSEEVQTGYSKENVGEVEDFSQDDLAADLSWAVKGEESKNHRSLTDQDPLLESILNLQSVQEALEKEVQKFGEIGKEPLSPGDNSVNCSGIAADLSSSDPEINHSSDQLGSQKFRQTSSNSLEVQALSLKQNVKLLESQLAGTRAMLEVKESRVAELEDIINISKSSKEESGSTIELLEDKCRELETELEILFGQKIEAEVEYIALKRTTQRWKFAAGNQIALLEEQEAVAGEQAQMLNKLGETEIRAAKLKERTEELGKHRGDILATEEVLTMQKKFCKITSCLFMQLILLGLAIWLFFLQLSPHQGVIVPT